MSEQQKPQVRDEEPELKDETLEQVAGGCAIDSQDHDPWTLLTLPQMPTV
jgi:hypothetical protein